jgi:uncharacterized protein with HEPN domain
MKPDPARVTEFLEHILQAISRISRYTSGMSHSDFAANSMVQDAVIRNIEIMGEAARNIELADPDFPAKHAGIPVRDIYLMRNRLSHGYFAVDLALVWNAASLSRNSPARAPGDSSSFRYFPLASATRARTNFFTSASGRGRSSGNCTVPFDTTSPCSSSLKAASTEAVGNKLQCFENAAYQTSTRSRRSAGMP